MRTFDHVDLKCRPADRDQIPNLDVNIGISIWKVSNAMGMSGHARDEAA
jgi:hypothetical protein